MHLCFCSFDKADVFGKHVTVRAGCVTSSWNLASLTLTLFRWHLAKTFWSVPSSKTPWGISAYVSLSVYLPSCLIDISPSRLHAHRAAKPVSIALFLTTPTIWPVCFHVTRPVLYFNNYTEGIQDIFVLIYVLVNNAKSVKCKLKNKKNPVLILCHENQGGT